MKDKRGWRVCPAFTLPGGFELWEQDDHCVDLYHGVDENTHMEPLLAILFEGFQKSCPSQGRKEANANEPQA